MITYGDEVLEMAISKERTVEKIMKQKAMALNIAFFSFVST
jgi:hypothetical protein